MEEMGKYNDELGKAGVLIALDGLTPPATMSARVTFKSGKSTVTDGPFTEAKEVVGGYWIIEVKSREEALNGPRASPDRITKWSKFAGCLTQPTSIPRPRSISRRGSATMLPLRWAYSK